MLTETRPRTSGATTQMDLWWVLAVASVLLASTLLSVFSPDMVTGSAQEHLPIVAMLSWFWGLVAVGYLAFVRTTYAGPALGLSVAILWLGVAVTSIFAPEMVTGSDPTQIPIAALVAPILGCLATAFLALNALRNRKGR
jgi:hypothetical protein